MNSPGIVIRPLREITGDELFNEVFFDDVFVPDEMVVGQVNDGWRLARTTLANERVAMAHGTALGNPMEELLRTVAKLELDAAEQDRLGELILAAQVGSLLDQRIAQLAVGGQDPGPQASARKLIGVRYRQALAEFRMELSDGGGRCGEREVHDFLNTRCLTIAGGTEQILLTWPGNGCWACRANRTWFARRQSASEVHAAVDHLDVRAHDEAGVGVRPAGAPVGGHRDAVDLESLDRSTAEVGHGDLDVVRGLEFFESTLSWLAPSTSRGVPVGAL